MEYTKYQVDAFAGKVFEGNPAAVIPLTEWLPEDTLQAIAMENNLSETAFFLPLEDRYHLRWFTPNREVRLCGHATLATAHVLYQHLGHQASTVTFDTLSGTVTVAHSGQDYSMNFPADLPIPISTPIPIPQALGFEPEATFEGKDDLLVVLDDPEQLIRLKPSLDAIRRLDARGLIVTAPGRKTDFISRCFYPLYGVDEDPVTGSAHTTLTPYWANRLGKPQLTAYQASRRGGHLQCVMLDERVELSGQAVTYAIGKIYV